MSHSERYQNRQRSPPRRFDNMRGTLQELFTGRSTVGSADSSPPQSPKTARIPLHLPNMHRPRIAIPFLPQTSRERQRRTSTLISTSSGRDRSFWPTGDSRPMAPTAGNMANVTVPRPYRNHRSTRSFVGVDPEDQQLADLAHRARRRKRQRQRSRSITRKCFPKIKNRNVRRKLLTVALSGTALVTVLAIYLGLSLTKTESQKFHVFIILLMLCITIFFCHALISLCLLLVHSRTEDNQYNPDMSQLISPGGFANPPRPIRVAMTRDEEAVGIESEATKFPPPAYGLWRESVRVDPDRIFWQRNEATRLERENSVGGMRGNGGRPSIARPPSYASDKGVEFVDAAQRTTAPDARLPLHPSERVRAGYGSSDDIV